MKPMVRERPWTHREGGDNEDADRAENPTGEGWSAERAEAPIAANGDLNEPAPSPIGHPKEKTPIESDADDDLDVRSHAPATASGAESARPPEKDERLISIDAITVDPRLQMRADRHREDYISDLVEAFRKKPLRTGVVLFRDPQGIMWLADGHARVDAHRRLGAGEVLASVRSGEFRDAWRFALKVNSRHGARRTKADIRLCVETALADDEMRAWTAGKIAIACAVSPRTVQVIRKERAGANDAQVPQTREGSDGKMYRTKKGAAKPKDAVKEDDAPLNADAGDADDTTAASLGPKPVKARTLKAIDQDLSWIEKHSSLLRERVGRVLNDVRTGAKPTRDIGPLRALRDELDLAIRTFEAGGAG